jgi:predicted Zn-dependent protease
MQLMHRLHVADPHDPWLQREWAEILVAQNRSEEAVTHFEAGYMSRMHACMQVHLQSDAALPRFTAQDPLQRQAD